MAKTKHDYHFLDIYNLDVRVAVNKQQLKDMCKELDMVPLKLDPDPAGATYCRYYQRGGAEIFAVCFWIDAKLWKKSGSDVFKLAEICAHEAAHGFGMIWNHIGGTMDHDTFRDDEPAAYLLGWLTSHLVRLAMEEK